MSYDIELCDAKTGRVLDADIPHGMTGGIYSPGDSNLWLNVTYNYAEHFYRVLDKDKGIRWLYGKTGEDTIERLGKAIRQLKNDVSVDYWEATEGNARRALENLLFMAKLRPDGVWNGD